MARTETLSQTDRDSIPTLARSRGMLPETVVKRVNSGMSLDDALSAPVGTYVKHCGPLKPDARERAIRQYHRVRSLLALTEATLRSHPRSVRALARNERLTKELAFLESLFETR